VPAIVFMIQPESGPPMTPEMAMAVMKVAVILARRCAGNQ
jgi:hypothetical protein